MKKVILGTGLLICGLLALIIATQNLHGLPFSFTVYVNAGFVFLICGAVLNILGFLDKK